MLREGTLCCRGGGVPFFLYNKDGAQCTEITTDVHKEVNDAVARLKTNNVDLMNIIAKGKYVGHLTMASKRMLDWKFAGIVNSIFVSTVASDQTHEYDKFVGDMSMCVPVKKTTLGKTVFRGGPNPFAKVKTMSFVDLKETFRAWFVAERRQTPSELPVRSYFAFVHSPAALYNIMGRLKAPIEFILELDDKNPYLAMPSSDYMIAVCPPERHPTTGVNPFAKLFDTPGAGACVRGLVFAKCGEERHELYATVRAERNQFAGTQIVVTYFDYGDLLGEFKRGGGTEKAQEVLECWVLDDMPVTSTIVHELKPIAWPAHKTRDTGACGAIACYRHIVMTAFPGNADAIALNDISVIQLITLLHDTPIQIAATGCSDWTLPKRIANCDEILQVLFENMKIKPKCATVPANLLSILREKYNISNESIGNSAVTLVCNLKRKHGTCATQAHFTDRAT